MSRYAASRAALEILRSTAMQAELQATELLRDSYPARAAWFAIDTALDTLRRELHRLETKEARQ